MTHTAGSWAAGIVNHGAYDDLERCLDSIAGQSRRATRVAVYDTQVDPARFDACRNAYPDVDFEAGPNIGYAAGANRVIAGLRGAGECEFILVLNPDIVLGPDFSARLIDSVVRAPGVAIATGKLLRPDGRTIDSAGIRFPRHRRPRDRGSETLDRGQFDRAERVDAASGAAMLLRVADLDGLSLDGELFDESFFAYHEDTDLCWRARRFGREILYEPAAVAVHARGWQKDQRERIPLAIRRHSFKNHYLQWVKNETLCQAIVNLPWLLCWEVLRFGFALLRDPGILRGYAEAWALLPEAFRKRKLIRQRSRALAGVRRRT